MKAKLTFDLPDDQEELTVAMNAKGLYLSLWDLDCELRELERYGDMSHTRFGRFFQESWMRMECLWI